MNGMGDEDLKVLCKEIYDEIKHSISKLTDTEERVRGLRLLCKFLSQGLSSEESKELAKLSLKGDSL